MEPQRIFLPLLLASTLAATPTPMPSPMPTPAKHTPPALTALYVAAGAALITLLVVSAHNQCERDPALCSCNNNNNSDDFDNSSARPGIGLTFHIPIP